MHIFCEQELLLHNISIVSKAVSSKSTLPILEYILLISDDNGFRMKGYDLQLGIETVNIDAVIKKKGVIALKAKMFLDIIRKLPKGNIEIIINEKNKAIIKANKSKFEILGQDHEDFPDIPVIKSSNTFTLESSVLKNMIKKTLFSVAHTENRPTLTGECFDVINNRLHIVAVDGYRISVMKEKIKTENDFSVIIPARTLDEVSKIIVSDEDNQVKLSFSDSHVLFETKECKIVSNLIEGEFIKYNQMFTDDYKTKININRLDLLNSLERTMLISNDSNRNPVKFVIDNKQLVITSNTEEGNCYEEIDIILEGDSLKIAFNPKYVIDVIKVIEDEKINLYFTSALSPCIIKSIALNTQKYLILPLRIKE